MPIRTIIPLILYVPVFLAPYFLLTFLLSSPLTSVSSTKKRVLAIPCIIYLFSIPIKFSCNDFALDNSFSSIALASCFRYIDLFFMIPFYNETDIYMSIYQIKADALRPFRSLPDPNRIDSPIKDTVASYHILPSAIVFLLLHLIIYSFLQLFTVEIVLSLPHYQFLLFCLLCGLTIYINMEIANRLFIFFATLIFCHGEYDQNEWHLLFKSPWMSTSLTEFWSIRWHQAFREIFVSFIYRPLRRFLSIRFIPLFGKYYQHIGKLLENLISIMGVFIISGIIHEYIIWTVMYQFWNPGDQILFFFLQSVGILFEKLFSQIFPSLSLPKWIGWLWTITYLCFTLPLFMTPYIKQKPW
ncbi:6765_t:CDS:1 [Scutellospora calospora]|uniref:6765_t:CDS:1 n=1 Tax=Scutellospora calospora TaxID=85575 RepID=A0ACA9MFL7_9GLOM|nr:6765_t:CDS:1 [Scutellospora calospora]